MKNAHTHILVLSHTVALFGPLHDTCIVLARTHNRTITPWLCSDHYSAAALRRHLPYLHLLFLQK